MAGIFSLTTPARRQRPPTSGPCLRLAITNPFPWSKLPAPIIGGLSPPMENGWPTNRMNRDGAKSTAGHSPGQEANGRFLPTVEYNQCGRQARNYFITPSIRGLPQWNTLPRGRISARVSLGCFLEGALWEVSLALM